MAPPEGVAVLLPDKGSAIGLGVAGLEGLDPEGLGCGLGARRPEDQIVGALGLGYARGWPGLGEARLGRPGVGADAGVHEGEAPELAGLGIGGHQYPR